MPNSQLRVQDVFDNVEAYEKHWHKKFKEHNPNWEKSEMYLNGQFDDTPYWIWEENSEKWRFPDED